MPTRADKAEVYSRLGLTLTYHPQDNRVLAEARPETIMYVGKCPRGDLSTNPGEISPDRGIHAIRIQWRPGASIRFRETAICTYA